jgi:hypothetical protein
MPISPPWAKGFSMAVKNILLIGSVLILMLSWACVSVVPSSGLEGQVIDVDPQQMLLTLKDLPPEPKYFLPGDTPIFPLENGDMGEMGGVPDTQEFIAGTGRIHGWGTNIGRGDDSIGAPELVFDIVTLYSTTAGASLWISDYSFCDPNYRYHAAPAENPHIGDQSIACVITITEEDGQVKRTYYLEFRFRNFVHQVGGYFGSEDVRPGDVDAIARTLLLKLQEAPLSDAVTFIPDEVVPTE